MKNFTTTPPPDGKNVILVHKICELYKLFHACLKLFPKEEKYILGEKIKIVILDILELILSASFKTKAEKINLIEKASDKNNLLKYLVRISFDIKCIDIKKYIILEEKIVEIGRMLGGWIKSIKEK